MKELKVVREIPTGDGVSGPYPVVYRLIEIEEEEEQEVKRRDNPIKFLNELPEEARGDERAKMRIAIRDHLEE